MPEMHLRQRVFVFVNHLQKTKQEYKNLKKQGIHNIIIKKKNYIKLVFNMTWLIEI